MQNALGESQDVGEGVVGISWVGISIKKGSFGTLIISHEVTGAEV